MGERSRCNHDLTWFCEEDVSLTMVLVEKCSPCQSLDITGYHAYGMSIGRPMHRHGSNLLLFSI